MGLPGINDYVKNQIEIMFPGTQFPDFEDIPGSTPPTEAKVQEIWDK
jgi:hypothetical protein